MGEMRGPRFDKWKRGWDFRRRMDEAYYAKFGRWPEDGPVDEAEGSRRAEEDEEDEEEDEDEDLLSVLEISRREAEIGRAHV